VTDSGSVTVPSWRPFERHSRWWLIVFFGLPYWLYVAASRAAAVEAWARAGAITNTAPFGTRLLQYLMLAPLVLIGFYAQLCVGDKPGRVGRNIALALGIALLCVVLGRPLLIVAIYWTTGAPTLSNDTAFFAMQPFQALSLWMVAYSDLALQYLFGAALLVGAQNWLHLRTETENRVRAELAYRNSHLESLRSKLRPHFLFNTLNVIASVVEVEPPRARGLIVRLSTLLRRSIDDEGREFVTLQHELDTLGHYLVLQQERFEKRLQVTIDVPEFVRTVPVPTFILQPLIENAVQHGLAGRSPAVAVTLRARIDEHAQQTLVVQLSNTFDAATPLTEMQSGMGLRLTRQRLHALYGDRAQLLVLGVHAGVFVVELHLPITVSASTAG
jgi:two-component system LytT family sensor kinase